MGTAGGQGQQVGVDIDASPEVPTQGLGLRDQAQPLMGEPYSGQFLSRIFLVSKKEGTAHSGQRPLNLFIHKLHFKMESLVMMRDWLQKDNWMA